TTMAPTTATRRLYRLKPVTPAWPKTEKIQPPTTAPTMPSTRSRTRPSPVLLTILLPRNPATMPRTIQARIDMCSSLTVEDLARRKNSPSRASKLWGGDPRFPEPRFERDDDPAAVEPQHTHPEEIAHSAARLRGPRTRRARARSSHDTRVRRPGGEPPSAERV